MEHSHKLTQTGTDLIERCALLEEKNRDLVARIRVLSEENRRNEGLLRALLEKTPFGIVLFDDKQRVIQLNKAAETLLQVERVNLIGKTCDAIFNCYTQQQLCPVLDENKTLDRVETDCHSAICHCDRHLLRSVVKIDDNNESVLVEAFVDISPIKQAQLEIENANWTKDDFLAKVSHELRTPLNAILGFTELLQDSFPADDNNADTTYLNNIIRSSKTLLRMIDDVLDITRVTARRLKLDEYPVAICSLVQQVSDEVMEHWRDHANNLTIECEAGVDYLLTDPNNLRKILFHLLDNAFKFTWQGEISVSISRQTIDGTDYLACSIKDSGEGMAEEQQARIFSGFEQVESGHTRSHGGAGLGLTLCKGISTLLGGEIQVKSEAGVGSEFVLLLPDKRLEE